MATLNLMLDKRRVKKDGSYPLVFKLRLKSQSTNISTGFSYRENQFDEQNTSVIGDEETTKHLGELNYLYLTRMREYCLKNMGAENIKELRKFVINKTDENILISEFWAKQTENFKTSNRFGSAKISACALSVLSTESNLAVRFNQFKYENLMELEQNLFKRGLSRNGINVYFRSFRAVFNQAIKYDLVGYNDYPFRKYRFTKERTTPRVLNIQEVKSYFELKISPSDRLYRSWLIGKLIFMLRGINIKDLLLLSSDNIKNNRIIYTRAKTGKLYSIELNRDIQRVFKEFNQNETLLGVLTGSELSNVGKLTETIAQRRKVINTHLKRIGKMINTKEPITTYVFRYSYANIAKQLGFSKDLIAEALGHEYGNSVTGIYLEQYDLKLVDKMNEQIYKKVKGVV